MKILCVRSECGIIYAGVRIYSKELLSGVKVSKVLSV